MRSRKQEAFRQHYETVHAQFERFCRARVYGEMDYRDLMNETLLVAWEKYDSLRNQQAFLGFLFGIVVRLLANDNRKRKRRELKTEDQPAVIHHPSDHQTDRDAEAHLLYQALAKLPDAQRECLILFEINGFPIREIATVQNASEAAVKKRLERGRQGLYKLLSDEPAMAATTQKEVSHG